MRIDGIFLPDVPVLSAALSDDLVLVVQRSGLLVQSYQNLTSTYYAIAGEIKIPGTVFTSQHGALQSGDILRVSEAEAAHLVTECKAAEYIAPAFAEVPAPADKRRRKAAI